MAAFLYLVAVLIVFCLWSGMILCILAAFYMLTKWMGRSLYKRLRPRPLSEPQPHYFRLPDGRVGYLP